MFLKAFLSISVALFAANAFSQTLVECVGFSYGDTEKVMISLDEQVYYLTEIDFEGREFKEEISEESYLDGVFPISPIRRAYKRTILRTEDGWKLKFSCGELHDLECTEY